MRAACRSYPTSTGRATRQTRDVLRGAADLSVSSSGAAVWLGKGLRNLCLPQRRACSDRTLGVGAPPAPTGGDARPIEYRARYPSDRNVPEPTRRSGTLLQQASGTAHLRADYGTEGQRFESSRRVARVSGPTPGASGLPPPAPHGPPTRPATPARTARRCEVRRDRAPLPRLQRARLIFRLARPRIKRASACRSMQQDARRQGWVGRIQVASERTPRFAARWRWTIRSLEQFDGAPGAELVAAGLDDLAEGRETAAPLLVCMARPDCARSASTFPPSRSTVRRIACTTSWQRTTR